MWNGFLLSYAKCNEVLAFEVKSYIHLFGGRLFISGLKVLLIWCIEFGGGTCCWVLIASSTLCIQFLVKPFLLSYKFYKFFIEFLVFVFMCPLLYSNIEHLPVFFLSCALLLLAKV